MIYNRKLRYTSKAHNFIKSIFYGNIVNELLTQVSIFIFRFIFQLFTFATLLIMLCVSSLAAEKQKRDYFSSRSQYGGVTSTTENPYNFNDDDEQQWNRNNYGTDRTFRRKNGNAAVIKQLDDRRSDGSYNYE